MAYPSIFNEDVSNQVIARINQLKADTPALWGKMNVGQMLAHCNVTYEMVYTDKHPKPNFILKFILKTFVKGVVVGQSPYKKNSSTAPQFIMKEDKNFEAEKALLIAHIQKTQKLGSAYFEGKESNSFGNLSADEWNVQFYKHLDHHLGQFGV